MSTIYRSNFYDVDSIGNFSAGDHTQLGVKLFIKTDIFNRNFFIEVIYNDRERT